MFHKDVELLNGESNATVPRFEDVYPIPYGDSLRNIMVASLVYTNKNM